MKSGGCKKDGNEPIEATSPVSLADVLHALSDPVRLHIVRLAAERERACNEFELDLPKTTLSHHFKVLREAGVIAVRTDGTRHLTSLNRKFLDGRFPGLMKAILACGAGVQPAL